MKPETADQTIEMGVVVSSDKIRLLVVLFLFVVIALSPTAVVTVPAAAYTALATWALLALYTHFMMNWSQLASRGRALQVAAAVVVGDLFCTFMLVYGTGGASSGFQTLFVLDIILSALLFTGLELALITGLAAALFGVVAVLTGTGIAQAWTASASVMSYIICAWLAHLLALVVRREKAANERIIRHLNEAVMLLDADGRVLVANPQAATICGLATGEMSGRLACELHDRPGYPIMAWFLEDVVRGGESQEPRIREARFGQDGDTVVYRCTTVPCAHSASHVVGWVVLCQDISDMQSPQWRSELEAELPQELAGALANLRAVSEALFGLSDTISSPQREQLLGTVCQQTNMLRSLVAELLEVGLIQTDDYHLVLRPLEVSNLLIMARRLCLLRARTKEVEVIAHGSDQPCLIRADEEKLWQVLAWACNRVMDCAVAGEIVMLKTELEGSWLKFIAQTRITESNRCPSLWDDDAGLAGYKGLSAAECRRIVELHGGRFEWEADGYIQLTIHLPAAGPDVSPTAEAVISTALADSAPEQVRERISHTVHALNNLLATIAGHASLAFAEPDIPTLQKALRSVSSCVQRAQGVMEDLGGVAGTQIREGGRGAILLGLEAAINQLEADAVSDTPVVIRDYPDETVPVSITPEQATRLFKCLLRYCLIPPEADQGIEVLVQVAPSCFTNDTDGMYVSVVPSVYAESFAEEIDKGVRSPGRWFRNELPNLLDEAAGVLSNHGGRVRPLMLDTEVCGCQVYLPVSTGPRKAAGAAEESPAVVNSSAWQGLRVLVIEDEESLAEIYREYLSLSGCQVTIAKDGDEGLAILQESDFDLVICDLIMPGASGEAIIEAVNASVAPCPVIVVTGQVNSALEEKCIAEGAYAVLHKPFPLTDLASLVSEVVDTQQTMLDRRPVMALCGRDVIHRVPTKRSVSQRWRGRRTGGSSDRW